MPYFKPYDVEVELTQLDYGDLAFNGEGPDGWTMVGVERKVTTDLINSMRSNRLSGYQLPGLMETYGFVFLVVEGIFRCGGDGALEMWAGRDWIALRTGSRPVLYREMASYLTTLELKCGVVVTRTGGLAETAAYVVGLYKWFQKPWEKHDAHKAIYAPGPEQAGGRRGGFSTRRANPVEVVAAQFPGVDKKAFEFSKRFGSVWEMVEADEKELAEVEGIGKKGAKRIWEWLRGL